MPRCSRSLAQVSDIPDTRQILRTTATDHDHAVFLQIMTFSGNIGHDRVPVGQLDTGDLSLGGVGFLWFHDEDLGTDALFLRTGIEEGRLWRVHSLRFLSTHCLVESDGEERRGTERPRRGGHGGEERTCPGQTAKERQHDSA